MRVSSLVPLVVVVAVVFGSACAGRLPSPEAPFAPAAGMPVYEGDVTIVPATGRLDAQWRIRVVADSTMTDSVNFVLNRGLVVTSLEGRDVARFTGPARSDEDWSAYTVHFTRRLPPGAVVELRIGTGGTPVFGSDGINRITPAWVELGLDAAWHPVFASFEQRIRGTVQLHLPEGWTAVASGTFHDHAFTNRVPLIDLAFSASPSLRFAESGPNRVYWGQSPDFDTTSAHRVLAATAECARYLNARFAEREPLPPAKIVLPPRSGPGYARQNYIVITDAAAQSSNALERFVCHELAHFWSTGARSSGAENWLNEAFAEYVSARFLRDVRGDSAFQPVLAQWKEQSVGQPPIWTPTATKRPSARTAYRKAPYLLYRLEERIGTPRMNDLLARYMVERTPTTLALLDVLRAVAGADTAEWFRQELAR